MDLQNLQWIREARRPKLAASKTMAGLDWIDVQNVASTSATLIFHFLTGGDGPTLLAQIQAWNVTIESESVSAQAVAQVDDVATVPDDSLALRVRIRYSPTSEHSNHWVAAIANVSSIDPFFSRCIFRLSMIASLNVESDNAVPPPAEEQALVDYTARDYEAFRQLMLDRLAVTDPAYKERHPADIGITLLESLAYVADRLSYYQDAVATEALLPRARNRISIRRHTRLLDYRLSEGMNGRTWVRFEVGSNMFLKKGSALVCGFPEDGTVIDRARFTGHRLLESTILFETMHDATLTPDCSNGIRIHAWGSPEYRLPKSTTKAWLEGPKPEGMTIGTIVLFEESLPANSATGKPEQVQCIPVRLVREPVQQIDDLFGVTITEIEWSQADALPNDLIVTTIDRTTSTIHEATLVYGNMVLADHGQTVENTFEVTGDSAILQHRNLTFAAPLDVSDDTINTLSLLSPNECDAKPCVELVEISPYPCEKHLASDALVPERKWSAQPDLLGCNPFARHFVVEMDDQRRAHVRFGDGQCGRRVRSGTTMKATYRIGNGPIGNVTRDSLRHLVVDSNSLASSSVLRITNPLPATSGLHYEDIETARRLAPAQMHSDERCVTPEDYVARACMYPEVARAAATSSWMGSASAILVYVERVASRPENSAFCENVRRYLQAKSIAGTIVVVFPPQRVPLQIKLGIVIESVGNIPQVRKNVLAALGARLGYEPPTPQIRRLEFGESVWQSDLVACAMSVAGVIYARVLRLHCAGDADSGDHNTIPEVIEIAEKELAFVANNPHFHADGYVEVEVETTLS